MFTEGIYPIGDGLLDIDEERLKGLLVAHDINEIYDVEQTPFARGKFAAVRRAIHKKSGVHFAAKFLKRRRRAQSSDKEIKHEIAVLMLCDGAENIVKLNAVHESRSDTALLLELATGGELQTFLDNEECLSEAQARLCMREVLKALQFLHKRSIAHLDLKPQNILLTGERIEDGLKLCDFGISRVVAEGTNVREIVGTPDYVAPEVLQYEPLSLLTDIWSVGVLAYVLLSGFSPFGGETKQETFLNISQCALTFPDKLFGGVSAAAIDFIRRALRIKPNDRMTAAGCFEHVWLKDECAIDRQMFSNRSKKSATEVDAEEDDDDVDDDEDEDEVEEEEEEDDEISTEDNNGLNGSKMDSSDAEVEIVSNGKTHNSSNATNGSTATKYTNGTNSPQTTATATTAPKTTTTILTVPATRATTIPLCNNMQQQQQQQQLQQHLHIAARRHSSADSNKENTFLTTKKIQAVAAATTAAATAIKKSTATATTIATVLIGGGVASTSDMTTTPSATAPVIATITLPNGSSSSSSGSSFFPDAPTTPKVIRKAPTTDTSPTSVKALVKKFQPPPHSNGVHSRKSTPAAAAITTTTTTNGKCTNGEQSKKLTSNNSNNNNNCNHISNMHASSNGRRASEPLTAVHKKLLPTSPTPSATSAPPTTATALAANVASYKSTCVFCLTCGGSNTAAGCRHSAAATTTMTLTSSSSGGSSANNSAPATPMLLGSNSSNGGGSSSNGHHHAHAHAHHHHHHQFHHHHHVVVAKSAAANNLSLDQGIIC